MKICMIEERYPPDFSGGASIYVKNIVDALSEMGHKVTVITTKPYENLKSFNPTIIVEGNIKIIRFVPVNIYDIYKANKVPFVIKPIFHAINLWNFFQYRTIKNFLKIENPDIVHIHSFDGLSISLFDSINNIGIPSMVTLHGCALLCPKTLLVRSSNQICYTPHPFCAIYRVIRKRIINSKPTIVTAPSQFILDIFTLNGFFKYSDKRIIKLGIDSKKFSGAKKKRNNAKADFDILFIGRLGWHKGVHILIKAFQQLTNNNIRLHIVGWGDYENFLKKICENDKRIIFHGKISNTEIEKIYQICDITVVPSICYENSPIVIYESFCAGVPIIASNIGGIPELIDEGYNGYLFEPHNINQLKDILKNIIEDRSLLELLNENALKSADKYEMSDHINKLVATYNEAIKLYGSS